MSIKNWLFSAVGIIGGAILAALGGWDVALATLVIMMASDYITGLLVAGVFKKSPKTETGALESRAGLKGITKKGCMLMIVWIACQLDLFMGTNFLRSTVIIGLCANELLSITENMGLMGLPMPAVIINAIDILKKKSGSQEGQNNG